MGRRPAFAILAASALMAAVAPFLMSRDVASVAQPVPSRQQPPPAERPDAIVVRARNLDDLHLVQERARALGYLASERTVQPPSLYLPVPAGVSLAEAVTAFASGPGVLYVEPAYPIRVADVPADPLYAQAQRDYMEQMRAPQAWDITTGSPGIIVAVLDTGLFIQHPDLAGRVWTNAREAPNNGIDDDANGCVDDVNGCSFLHSPNGNCAQIRDGNITDDVGHGTFVAGVIAAAGNGAGMVGVARNATVLPVKILDCDGSGNTFSLAQGILYAAEHGARIINVSLGGPIDSAYVRETIRVARERYGAVVVAATGNSGGGVSYPARYPEVLAVGGTDSSGTGRAGFSNSGPEVDVVAFSVGILGTAAPTACGRFNCLENNAEYARGDGTSFAAPIVSGLAALILARNPLLHGDGVASIIRGSADPMPASDRPDWAGAGRVNMLRALQPNFRIGSPGSARN